MHEFRDYYGHRVRLAFTADPFSASPGHVWVICRCGGQWLLTDHPRRGLEFPGGKVEQGETADEAAVREVMEETGGVVESLHYLGQYEVQSDIVKNIYFASIAAFMKRESYEETNGPVLLEELPDDIRADSRFSYLMKDDVLALSLLELRRRGWID
ncbi:MULTISPECIES: RNA deprotection pyrophosphohydrolase [Geobacillus]|uniref:Nucleoside triphosphatase YtkD n=1 Tax=Geobacillus thermocatenulatus TaxID=33938 RepID=A0A226QB80_9BACL|nr:MULTISPECIES: nucleoside triphosphatase YtkD [Geobacillus]ASS98470.1 nucleoside triphosphatase YtkD [Geobacillus thermocatenulatus]KLR74175.1 7,8-dihydro-8-oxoguanine-triphosphatase [Geobacillus sp. T6]KPC98628.1 putative 8-oxo-dGTP diphosphatase YtkD [Geobacillus sp. BCO2]OXB89224.1 nucleoside triphosphatase YtkD [Geobacillus thermocatenulatus]